MEGGMGQLSQMYLQSGGNGGMLTFTVCLLDLWQQLFNCDIALFLQYNLSAEPPRWTAAQSMWKVHGETAH